jgi:hypothetical protein
MQLRAAPEDGHILGDDRADSSAWPGRSVMLELASATPGGRAFGAEIGRD